MRFDRTKPCSNCPFRNDVAPFLTAGRALEIAQCLIEDQGTFACHKSVDYSAEEPEVRSETQHCAGALIILERMERPNQMMRWMERLGGYDRSRLQMDAPVFETLQEWLRAH